MTDKYAKPINDIDRYAVVGNPIWHSKSPQIHAAFAKQTGQHLSYEAILATIDGFAAEIKSLIAQGYKGVNVTVPFKFEAFNLCDELTERATSAKAVNTLSFIAGKIFGDNTDGAGLVTDVTQNLKRVINGQRVLLMGAGGAAYGVVLPLIHAGAKLSVANRTPEKAKRLADTYTKDKIKVWNGSYEDFENTAFDIVINATSSGLRDELPAISEKNFANKGLAYDMMYSRPTPFRTLAFDCESQNVQFADGLGMLVEQAAEAFYVWRGVRPETAPIIAMLRS